MGWPEIGGRAGDLLMGRWKKRILLLALPGAGLAVGCLGGAERTYFDDLLDGSADATSDQSAAGETSIADGSMLSDATIDASNSRDDALPEPDAEVDSPTAFDGGVDGADAEGPPHDAGMDASAGDADAAVVEAGCGPTTTTTNCGACGVSCDHSHSSPTSCTAGTCNYSGCDAGWGDCVPAAPNTNGCETQLNSPLHCTACNVACDTTNSVDAGCNGTTCTYASCKPGWSMCKTTAPNAGGCTCNTPGCCVDAGTCQTTHSNGFSQSFYDCNPLNTWTDKSARAACAAYTGSPAQCTDDQTCTGFPDAGPYVCNGALNHNCDTCWSYAGTDIGTVTNCDCPGVRFGTYN
jgi:hypothetical protein